MGGGKLEDGKLEVGGGKLEVGSCLLRVVRCAVVGLSGGRGKLEVGSWRGSARRPRKLLQGGL